MVETAVADAIAANKAEAAKPAKKVVTKPTTKRRVATKATPTVKDGEKVCTRCGESKPLAAFHVSSWCSKLSYPWDDWRSSSGTRDSDLRSISSSRS